MLQKLLQKIVHKTAEATGEMIGDNITDKIVRKKIVVLLRIQKMLKEQLFHQKKTRTIKQIKASIIKWNAIEYRNC